MRTLKDLRLTLSAIAAVAAGLLVHTAPAGASGLDRTVTQWQPVEWSLPVSGYSGNPFDIPATATFTHGDSGETRTTGLFYAGDNTWKLRFTGTRPGSWTFTTTSEHAELSGLEGTVTIKPAGKNDYGFVVHQDHQWARQKGPGGTLERFVPQYVMYPDPSEYHNDPAGIDADIQIFLVQHGFNGFHTNVFCRWFDIDKERSDQIDDDDPNPDLRTFEALETLIGKVNQAGGLVHIWKWCDEDRRMTPIKWGINGTVDRRLQRYIAARLGPLPGWSMGYGADLFEWVNTDQLASWHGYMHEHFGWMHYLGGRSHTNRLNQIYEDLDYSSYEQHHVDYDMYVATIEARPHKPSFSEDRFRVGMAPPWVHRSYSEVQTRRGLYHSTLVGGVGNIWGNLVGAPGYWSMPYPNPHWSRTYADFFHGRFLMGMVRDNAITDGLGLRMPDFTRFIFYREDADSISMDLSNMPVATSAVAVDTSLPYDEISLGVLQPGKHNWTAPYAGDWVIAVENHADTRPPSVPANVTAEARSHGSIKVTWTASTDDTGVKYYKVFRDGKRIGTVPFPAYLDTGLEPETAYSYTISAGDFAGHESARSSPPAAAKTLPMPNQCSIDLGARNVSDMLFHPQNRDGNTTGAVAAGQECRRPIGTRDQFFYFAIDDNFMYDEPGTTRYLKVRYFDDQPDSVYLQPQYDAIGEGNGHVYRNAEPVNFTNTGRWKTATWTLTECKFANRQNAGADFRIFLGPNEVKIASVTVSKVPFDRHTSGE